MEITNSGGAVIWSEGNENVAGNFGTGNANPDADPTNAFENNTAYEWDVPLSSVECYTFTIYDYYGDGIDSEQWNGTNGALELKDNFGGVIYSLDAPKVIVLGLVKVKSLGFQTPNWPLEVKWKERPWVLYTQDPSSTLAVIIWLGYKVKLVLGYKVAKLLSEGFEHSDISDHYNIVRGEALKLLSSNLKSMGMKNCDIEKLVSESDLSMLLPGHIRPNFISKGVNADIESKDDFLNFLNEVGIKYRYFSFHILWTSIKTVQFFKRLLFKVRYRVKI